ncbi:MAG: response regulator [Stomatobaculum sp.]
MRALIVDDEPLVISAARLLVDWKRFGIAEILEAGSAEEALKLLREQRPELVFSDIRMPGMSGLELIRAINEIDSSIRTILITAYGDFSYAREAIHLGCVDYILKPLQEEDLNNAVAKAVSQYSARQSRLDADSQNHCQDLLSLWFSNGLSAVLFSDIPKSAPFLKDLSAVRIGAVSLRQLPDAGTLVYTLAGTAHGFLYGRRAGGAVVGASGDILLLFNDTAGTASIIAGELLSELENSGAPELHLGLSGTARFPEQAAAALTEARTYALSYNLQDHSTRIHRSALPAVRPLTYDEMEKTFYLSVLSGRESRIREVVRDFSETMAVNGCITLRQLENFRSIYTGLRNKWLLGFIREQSGVSAAAEAPRLSFLPQSGIFSMEYFRELLAADLLKLSETCVGRVSADTEDTLHRVRRWIDAHYTETLTLELMAGEFSLSAAHLSRSFKKEFGIGPTEYITRRRIERAKELISDSRLRLSDIAENVGYQDAKYFSRVFRKVTGQSPAEYRLSKNS